jgi:hypothetical protein
MWMVVGVAGLVPVLRLGLESMSVLRLLRELVALEHVDFGAGDAAAVDLLNPQAGADAERDGGVVEHLRRYSGIDQRSQEHVAGDSGEAIKIGNTH